MHLRSSDVDRRITEFLDELIGGRSRLTAPFLSNSAMMYLVEKITDVKSLVKMYGDYSYFIHTYTATWQGIPFSSVLEIKILKYEIKKFLFTIRDLVDSYYKLTYQDFPKIQQKCRLGAKN